tara:strand:+ start:836 stop:1219 length:384 start_codon:yes stop_codon:yes gene_type:complete
VNDRTLEDYRMMFASSDIFDMLADDTLGEKSDLETYVSSVRDVIVAKKEPYYTITKNKIHSLIDSDQAPDTNYVVNMGAKLNQMKDRFTSEFVTTMIDIYVDFIKADNTIINKEGLEYLNKLWKDKP